VRAYLDNSAATAVAPEVIDAMLPYFSHEIGNAQSVHAFGQRARAALEAARRQVAALIGASPGEVVFVSGGTEADNLAVRGVAEANVTRGKHIVTTTIEHPAVLAVCEYLESTGFEVTYLPASENGLISIDAAVSAIREDTVLVSIMHANNEIGVIQPIREIGEAIRHARGDRNIPYFHSDAVQSAGKIPVDVNGLGVDLLSVSSHKIHGPKGAGALYVRKGVRLNKLMHGGHHERDRRAGTENVPGIVGFGKAAELALADLESRSAHMRELRDRLERRVFGLVHDVRLNGGPLNRLPNISNLSFGGLDGESLLISLDLRGVAVSTGAACASGSLEPSHVLKAMGLDREAIRGSLRFSLSALTTREEIDYTVDVLVETVERLRAMAPDEEASRGCPAS
jgi:cysteine desulfurase